MIGKLKLMARMSIINYSSFYDLNTARTRPWHADSKKNQSKSEEGILRVPSAKLMSFEVFRVSVGNFSFFQIRSSYSA